MRRTDLVASALFDIDAVSELRKIGSEAKSRVAA
jgi:hypothetical protein